MNPLPNTDICFVIPTDKRVYMDLDSLQLILSCCPSCLKIHIRSISWRKVSP